MNLRNLRLSYFPGYRSHTFQGVMHYAFDIDKDATVEDIKNIVYEQRKIHPLMQEILYTDIGRERGIRVRAREAPLEDSQLLAFSNNYDPNEDFWYKACSLTPYGNPLPNFFAQLGKQLTLTAEDKKAEPDQTAGGLTTLRDEEYNITNLFLVESPLPYEVTSIVMSYHVIVTSHGKEVEPHQTAALTTLRDEESLLLEILPFPWEIINILMDYHEVALLFYLKTASKMIPKLVHFPSLLSPITLDIFSFFYNNLFSPYRRTALRPGELESLSLKGAAFGILLTFVEEVEKIEGKFFRGAARDVLTQTETLQDEILNFTRVIAPTLFSPILVNNQRSLLSLAKALSIAFERILDSHSCITNPATEILNLCNTLRGFLLDFQHKISEATGWISSENFLTKTNLYDFVMPFLRNACKSLKLKHQFTVALEDITVITGGQYREHLTHIANNLASALNEEFKIPNNRVISQWSLSETGIGAPIRCLEAKQQGQYKLIINFNACLQVMKKAYQHSSNHSVFFAPHNPSSATTSSRPSESNYKAKPPH
jgi:hypothetical protein